jgi:hypothetical protein
LRASFCALSARCCSSSCASCAATRSSDSAASAACPGRFHPQFRDKNRRDIGKSQSIWTDPKMETARLTFTSRLAALSAGLSAGGAARARTSAACYWCAVRAFCMEAPRVSMSRATHRHSKPTPHTPPHNRTSTQHTHPSATAAPHVNAAQVEEEAASLPPAPPPPFSLPLNKQGARCCLVPLPSNRGTARLAGWCTLRARRCGLSPCFGCGGRVHSTAASMPACSAWAPAQTSGVILLRRRGCRTPLAAAGGWRARHLNKHTKSGRLTHRRWGCPGPGCTPARVHCRAAAGAAAGRGT